MNEGKDCHVFGARHTEGRRLGGRALALAAALAIVRPDAAAAAQANVYFNGNLTTNNPCVILVDQAGTLAANSSATQLSSKLPGGQSGIARVVSLSNYWISVDEVNFFTSSPPNGSDNTTFTALFSGQNIFRGRTFAERPGNSPVRLRNGYSITQLTVNLVVDKPDGFPAGDYDTFTIVRCE
jgi:hypothetical protein